MLIADLIQNGVLRQHQGLDAAILVGAGLGGLRLADMGLGLCRLQSTRFGLADELVDLRESFRTCRGLSLIHI